MNRDNLVGLLLLAVCGVFAAVLIVNIAAGTRPRYNGPGWLAVVVAVLFIGGSLYGLVTMARGWPDPRTGRRGRRPRWWPFGRRDDDGPR